MKKKTDKNRKRKVRAFVCTFSVCMLSFALILGLYTAYFNSNKAISGQQAELIGLYQTSFEEAEFTVLGKKYDIKLKEEKPIPMPLYVLVPPYIRIIFSGLECTSNAYNL